jgi:hypothetical protein
LSRGLGFPFSFFKTRGIQWIHQWQDQLVTELTICEQYLPQWSHRDYHQIIGFTPHSNRHYCQTSQTGRTIRPKLSSKRRDKCHGCPGRTAAV